MGRLSVVMLAKNEAWRIAKSLQSVQFADEIIVADTGSSDNTAEVVVANGATIHDIPFNGFGEAKQTVLEMAQYEWVLSLDADEIVSEELANEIKSIISDNNSLDGYEIPRRAWFLGKAIKYGGWGISHVLRLVRREKAHFTLDLVHEKLIVDGRTAKLNGLIEHHTDPEFPAYLAKIDRYSTLAAQKLADNPKKRVGLYTATSHAITKAFKMFVIKQGWRDGVHGGLLAASSAYSVFLRYVKADLIRKGELKVFQK